MKKILCILSFISVFGNAQNLAFQWAKSISGSGPEVGYGVTLDASGNVYSAGSFSGTTDFDPGVATVTVTTAGTEDIYISKLDASGNFVWAKTIGASGSDVARSITSDAAGNIYVTGYFAGTVDFDPGAAVYNLTSTGGLDIFVLKLSSAGTFVSAFSVGGASGTDVARSISVDGSNNIYITGYYFGTADFDPGVGTTTLSASAGFDIHVCKYTSAGVLVFAKSMGGATITEMGTSLKVDASGNVYVGGFFGNTVDFDPGVGTYTMTSFGPQDPFILKLNTTGNFIWAKQVGNTFGNGLGDIALDGLGNVLATGAFYGTVDFDPGVGVANLTEVGSGMGDCFILKLDGSGNYIWATSFGSTSSEGGVAIRTDAANNIYTTGTFQTTVDFDPGVGVYNLTAASSDVFISKLNAAGNFLAAVKFGGSAVDVANSIAVDASNNVYTTGSFNTTADFDPGSPAFPITSAGSTDAFVQKLFPCVQPTFPTSTTASVNLSICPGQSTTLSATGSGTVSWFTSSTSTTVLGSGSNFTTPTLTTGTYTYYAEAFTCMNSANRTPVTITVNPTPTITVNSGTVCNGSSFTVIPSGASTYSYMNSTTGSSCVTGPILTNTSFSLIGTSVNGCTNTASSSITVVSLPNITVGPPSAVVCNGSYITLFSGGASTYTWVSGPVTPTFAVNPTVFSTYTVVGTSSLGCTSSNTINVGVLTTPTVNLSASSANICSGDASTLTASGATSYLWNTSATTSTISVTPSTTTTYTVTGTILSCTDTKLITISVTPSPTISIANSSSVICTGGSATLSIIGAASSYTWNTGPTTTSIVVTPTTNTTYTAAGFTGACYGLAVTTVSVGSSITVNASATNSNICIGATTTITASGATTYTWNTSSNSASIVVSPTTTTTYSVNGTSGSCLGSSNTTVFVNACVGIHEYENNLSLSIYPNPISGNDKINIHLDINADLQIIDVLGKTIISVNLNQGDNSINVSQLNAGIYYFEIKNENGKTSKKVIKN